MTQTMIFLMAAVSLTAFGMDGKTLPQKDNLEGAWTATSWKRGDREIGKDQVNTELVIGKNSYEFPKGINRISKKGSLKIDAAKGTIDLVPEDGPAKGKTFPGIYKVSGDTLTICFTTPGKDRPRELKTNDRNTVLAVYQRKK